MHIYILIELQIYKRICIYISRDVNILAYKFLTTIIR